MALIVPFCGQRRTCFEWISMVWSVKQIRNECFYRKEENNLFHHWKEGVIFIEELVSNKGERWIGFSLGFGLRKAVLLKL